MSENSIGRITNINKPKSLLAAITVSVLLMAPFFGPMVPTQNANAQSDSTNSHLPLKSWETMTPAGIMNKTNIHQYDGHVVNADAVLADLAKHGHKTTVPVNGQTDELAYYNSGTALTSFSAKWIVPQPPANNLNLGAGEVDYIWPGLQDAAAPNSHIVIQPVLQWGASTAASCNCWKLAAWMAIGSTGYPSTAISANTGDVIYGHMELNYGQVWTITVQDLTTGQSTSEQVSTGYNFYYAIGSALETGLLAKACQYVPGDDYFYSVLVNGGTVTWSSEVDHSYCNLNPQVSGNWQSSDEVFLKIQHAGGIWNIAKEQSTGNLVPGLNFDVYDPNNNLIGNSFTPGFTPITTSGTYNIHFNNYGTYYLSNTPSTTNYNVYNWGGLVTGTFLGGQQGRVIGTYYNSNNAGNYALVTYQAQSGGSSLSGMYGGFRDSSGNLLSQGYTPYTVGLPITQHLTVYWNNYGTHTIQSTSTTATQISYTPNPPYGAIQVISIPTRSTTYTDTGTFS